MNSSIIINKELKYIEDFIRDPLNMPMWTGHQTIYKTLEGKYQEIRLNYNLDFQITKVTNLPKEISILLYTWANLYFHYEVKIRLNMLNEQQTKLDFDLTPEHLHDKKLLKILCAELRLLRYTLEKLSYKELNRDVKLVNKHHLKIYQRKLPNLLN